jgi:uncharacterized protein (DUF2062 family)
LQSRPNKLKWSAKALLCFLAISSLLLAIAMEASPSLHKFIHRDADSAAHICIVTMLASGQVHSTGAPGVLPILVCAVFLLVIVEFLRPHCERDLRLPVGRAPPLV